ncbi:hypothetical protein AB9E29_19860 [Rhizobium leguminosarum]|uniref:hypothetical protein n=1 Tax=Rhizobium leguminosarum TaxID=384 RepID=UPI003F9AAEEF
MIDDDPPCQSFAPIKGGGLACLHLTEVELAEISSKAIAKLADLVPMTNDGDTSIHPPITWRCCRRHPAIHRTIRGFGP